MACGASALHKSATMYCASILCFAFNSLQSDASFCSLRATKTKLCFNAANCCAMALPIPSDAPVINVTFIFKMLFV
ncbi:hypothetical protein D9M69_697090 [compost metagenome]